MNNRKGKNTEEELDEALSLTDKFDYKEINVVEKENNNFLCYVPEEITGRLCSINFPNIKDNKNNNFKVEFKYLKHNKSYLNKKRNNNDSNLEIESNSEIFNNNTYNKIFNQRKKFYSNDEIKKYLDKDYYSKFIKQLLLFKEKLKAQESSKSKTNNINILNNYQNDLKTNYNNTLNNLTLGNISSCFLKGANIQNYQSYANPSIYINSLFLFLYEKIKLMPKDKQIEIMFVGESGIGKTYSLYLYTFLLRLNPFNLVLTIFDMEEFLKNPIKYLQEEIAYSLYYVCNNNSELDLDNFKDCLSSKSNDDYEFFLTNISNLFSNLFEAYDDKLSLYLIIDEYEKIKNNDNKQHVSKFIDSLYSANVNIDGTGNKLEERFKIIYSCSSDGEYSDWIIKEKFNDFNKSKLFTEVNYANFFERGIIFLEPIKIYKECEILYYIDKNNCDNDFLKSDNQQLIQNIILYSNHNFKKISTLIKDKQILHNAKDPMVIINLMKKATEELLLKNIFKKEKIEGEKGLSIIHNIYSTQKLEEIKEDLAISFFTKNYINFNYSLVIPEIKKCDNNINVVFKFKNKEVRMSIKNLDLNKYYKIIDLEKIPLDFLEKEYAGDKSFILKGLIIEEILFIIFKQALNFSENHIIELKCFCAKFGNITNNNIKNTCQNLNLTLYNVEKSMSKETDVFEKQNFFSYEINKETDGIYFLSHKFPCIDCVIKNGKELYLIQIKKTLFLEHIQRLYEDMHYFYLLMRNEETYREMKIQNERKLKKISYNTITKLNFFINLADLYKKNYQYNINFMFIYQSKENSLEVNKTFEDLNLVRETKDIKYKLEGEWGGAVNHNDYEIKDGFLVIKYKFNLPNILLSSIDNFSNDVQKLLKFKNAGSYFNSLKD